jgi:hypothetical protein
MGDKAKTFEKGSNVHNGGPISNSGSGRYSNDNRAIGVGGPKGYSTFDAMANLGSPKKPSNYGQGKHSKGGKPKQNRW